MPRLYREAPVNAIWEGSGNVMCLDVLRAVARDRDAAPQLLDQLVGETKGLPGASAAAKTVAEIMSRADSERLARAGGRALGTFSRDGARSMPRPRRAGGGVCLIAAGTQRRVLRRERFVRIAC